MLSARFTENLVEAGCDEAGRGSLAGPVFAAAVIFPKEFRNDKLDDSKKLSAKKRYALREVIEKEAMAWAVESVGPEEIDKINILHASFRAMHKAIKKLAISPEILLIDGNHFDPFPGIPHQCIIKGDGKYLCIAAASILAKTYRDDYMIRLHEEFPVYNWKSNKGYPSRAHREGLASFGVTPYHRKSYNLFGQLSMEFK
ncbi:MAG: ribonuclease HII [Bacteroidota bacterium]|nr:ribonuclease HII [Bacteroidota bacterium]